MCAWHPAICTAVQAPGYLRQPSDYYTQIRTLTMWVDLAMALLACPRFELDANSRLVGTQTAP